MKLHCGHPTNPAHLEIDLSWASLHSCLRGLFDKNLEQYSDRCWRIVNFEAKGNDLEKGIIHLCTSHLMHTISRKLTRILVQLQITLHHVKCRILVMLSCPKDNSMNHCEVFHWRDPTVSTRPCHSHQFPYRNWASYTATTLGSRLFKGCIMDSGQKNKTSFPRISSECFTKFGYLHSCSKCTLRWCSICRSD